MVLDLALLTMIVTCIVYCWILNRRIQELQNSRIEFARMIKELNISIVKAESSITELNELSKVTGNQLMSSTSIAKGVVEELTVLNDIGNNLIKKLMKQQATSKSKTDSIKNEDKGVDLFSDEDLAVEIHEVKKEKRAIKHNNKLKNVITKINIAKDYEDPINLNQLGYYDSLRKISANKK